MKKSKLKLTELRIASFITSADKIKGGTGTVASAFCATHACIITMDCEINAGRR